jgi:hypothetical protein
MGGEAFLAGSDTDSSGYPSKSLSLWNKFSRRKFKFFLNSNLE